jgi:hypothetical protein
LFGLLADGDYETNNNGNAKASSLAVELTAGGLDPEHVGYVSTCILNVRSFFSLSILYLYNKTKLNRKSDVFSNLQL